MCLLPWGDERRNGRVSPDFIEAAQIRRQGDLLTGWPAVVCLFLRLLVKQGPRSWTTCLAGTSETSLPPMWTGWASELDIHYLIQASRKHGGIRPSQEQAARMPSSNRRWWSPQTEDDSAQTDQDEPDAVEQQPQADSEQEHELEPEPQPETAGSQEPEPEPEPEPRVDPGQSADISQVAEPDSVDSAETAEMESPDGLQSDLLTSEGMDGAGVA